MRALALLMVAGACGDGVPAPDAMPPRSGEPGLVRVRYGGPDPAHQRVLFQAADSSVVLATHTDAVGSANAFMEPGGFATMIVTAPAGPKLYTWAGVQPGDDLVVDDGGFVATAPVHPVAVSIPWLDDVFDALYSRCTDPPGIVGGADITPAQEAPIPVAMFDCDGTADLLVVHGLTPTQYLFAHAADITGPSEVAVAGPYHDIEMSSVTVDRIPEDWSAVVITRTLLDRGVAYFSSGAVFAAVGPEHQIANNLRFASPADAVMRVAVGPALQPGALGRLHVAHWGPPEQFTRFDLGAVALRPFTSAPTYDASANAIRWTEGPGELPDAALVEWRWSSAEIGGLDWMIVAPRGDEPAIHLPVLPGDLGPDLAFTTPSIIGLATFKISGGYDATRSHMLDAAAFDQFPAVGVAGDVVTQQLDTSQTE